MISDRHGLGIGGSTVALFLLLTLPRVALAQARVRLEWSTPDDAECLSSHALEAAVEARLRRPVFAAQTVEEGFLLEGAITHDDRRFRARMELVAPDGSSLGTRVLEGGGDSCSSLSDSLALVVSLLVEQNQRRIVLYQPPPPPPVVQVEPREPEGDARRALEPRRAPWTFRYSVGGSLRGVDTPWPTWSVNQMLRFTLPGVPLTLTVEAALAPPRVVTGQGSRAEVWSWTAGAGICPELGGSDRLRSVTCLSLLGGQQSARGRGLDVDRSGHGPLLALVLRAGAELQLAGPLRVGLAALAEAALLRADLVFGSVGTERTLFAGAPLGVGAELWISLALSG